MNLYYFFLFIIYCSDPSDDKPIPADVILIGCTHGQICLQTYKYYAEDEVRTMIDQLELLCRHGKSKS